MLHSFLNEQWDILAQAEKENILYQLILQQYCFNKQEIKFCSKFYRDVRENKILDYCSAIAEIPKISRSNLMAVDSPYSVVPKAMLSNKGDFFLQRGTGGTGGKVLPVFYTSGDWQASMSALYRYFKPGLAEITSPIIAYNNYNFGHISAPIFNDVLVKLGAIVIARHFKNSLEESLRDIIKYKCNVIISPPASTHKGSSIQELLEMDSSLGTNYINSKNVSLLIISSTELTEELYEEIKDLGIKVINCYGSTEVLPVGISCQENPFVFHLTEGHIYSELIKSDNSIAKEGERGRVIVGRIGAEDAQGKIRPASSVFLNYYNGDEAVFLPGDCVCGRKTRRIADINRVENIQEKNLHGCQAW